MNVIDVTFRSLFLICIIVLTNITAKETQIDSRAELCGTMARNRINVTYRSSTSFTAVITYNCSFYDHDLLSVVHNEILADNCHTHTYYPTTVALTIRCDRIEKHAGRNWTFSVIQRQSLYNKELINETFVITLRPLSLRTTAQVHVTLDRNQTTALIFINNCLNISHETSLIFRCNEFDQSNRTLQDDCTYTCSNLEPGSVYVASLIRLPIQISDHTDNIDENRFPEEIFQTVYQTDLSKLNNLYFTQDLLDKQRMWIHFNRPSGSYDQVSIICTGVGGLCLHDNIYLMNTTGNCSYCDSISIRPIVRGMRYECQAWTIKGNFLNVSSDATFSFSTNLEPMLYNGSNSSSTNRFYLQVTPQSDFNSFELTCRIDNQSIYPCSNLSFQSYSCETFLSFHGVLGCKYKCVFVTKKSSYDDTYSSEYELALGPLLFVNDTGSTWIFITWELDSNTYIDSFTILANQSPPIYCDYTAFEYNLTNLSPNHFYELQIKYFSLYVAFFSDTILVKTYETAPPVPTYYEIETKIISKDDAYESTSEQHLIEMDRSLFSDENGFVKYYLIYVRQDRYQYQTSPYFPGTYYEALLNSSIDYLALFITSSSFDNKFENQSYKTSLLLGEQTWCTEESPVCNGKLKPDRIYKILVGGCTIADCTFVLSEEFRTKAVNFWRSPLDGNMGKPSSKAWIAVFPIVGVLVVLIVLIIWKRKKLLKCCSTRRDRVLNINNQKNIQKGSSSSSYIYSYQPMKPKLLVQYTNLTDTDHNTLNTEFQTIKDSSPIFHPLKKFVAYDRYVDIPCRGPWSKTAVHLIGQHRIHDYINANEIRGVNSLKQYIACQSPLESTCDDFWDMVIQYGVRKIVMLNHFTEFNSQQDFIKDPCHPYIPMNINETLNFKRIKIQLNNIKYDLNKQLEIRHLSVDDGVKQHHVIHFFFTAWSKHDTINSRTLIDLIETVNKYEERPIDSVSPMIVHCSSGTGRTGTYISVDIIIRLMNRVDQQLETMELDVMGVVNQLRQDRTTMVQTKEQYLLIHHCVEEYLRRINRLESVMNVSNEYASIRYSLLNEDQNGYIEPTESNTSTKVDASSNIINMRKEQFIKNIPENIQNNGKILNDENNHYYVESI